MDFSTINTAADAELGTELHLRHPQLGHFLYTGEGASKTGELSDKGKKHEPVIVGVRGMESDTVQSGVTGARKRAMKGVAMDEEKAGLDLVVSLVTHISGVFDGKRKITTAPDDLRWFFGRSDNFIRQVMDFAKEPAHFFCETAKG